MLGVEAAGRCQAEHARDFGRNMDVGRGIPRTEGCRTILPILRRARVHKPGDALFGDDGIDGVPNAAIKQTAVNFKRRAARIITIARETIR